MSEKEEKDIIDRCDIEDIIVEIVDTRKSYPEDSYEPFGWAGLFRDNKIVTFHITDDPARVCRILETDVPLDESGDVGIELGKGLYASAHTEFWKTRSRNRWKPLEELPREKRDLVADKILTSWHMRPRSLYLTQKERDFVKQRVAEFQETGDLFPLYRISGQPFNFDVTKDEFLTPLGIEPNPPIEIELHLKGKFAHLSQSNPPQELLDCLKQEGVDGAFTQFQMMGTNAEIVIWNKDAIKYINGICKKLEKDEKRRMNEK